MAAQIDELVKMRDIETLYEIMTEHEDWFIQLEAAEGLVKLGDRCGYESLVTAAAGADEEIVEVAREILESPELARMKNMVEAERESERRANIELARKRLQTGGKVFRYKMVYLPIISLMSDDPLSNEYNVLALDKQGLHGWEVVSIFPQVRPLMVTSMDDRLTGAHFLLKKEILPHESADLDKE